MAPEDPAARRVAALARGAAYNVALAPAIFGWLAAIPALGIGETSFDPDFARGSIDGASLCLASAVLPGLERAQQLRQQRARALAGAIGEHTGFSPLLASGADAGAYPRLGVLAPHPAARDEAVRVLTSIGVTAMYPSALTEIPELGPHLVGDTETPRSRDFASRLLTVPTNRALQERESALLIERLRELS
jgi:dTDP-4-amino-4,6-dideoxygalactose transaminase